MEDGFSRQVIADRAASLFKELCSLQAKVREDSIHDTRVASRRMRTALEAFQDLFPARRWKALYDRVKQITRLLGKTREATVDLSLLQELAAGDMAENLCREYLQERFDRKLRKGLRRVKKKLRLIDAEALQAQMVSLVGELPATIESGGSATRRPSARSRLPRRDFLQPDLFDLSTPPWERAFRVLGELASRILSFQAGDDFGRATDLQLHELRIAAKKLRYAMEIFDPIWPAGLKKEIRLARALQDAGGHYHDWCVLRDRIQKEIGRLTQQETQHLAFQMGRLLEQFEGRRVALRKKFLPALSRLQKSLHALLQQAPQPVAPRVRTKRSPQPALPDQT